MFKNSKFTHDYCQPTEYRFSLDSVFLAQMVAQRLMEHPLTVEERAQMSVLDLCSGCGVIGMELHFHLPEIKKIDFLEVQELYRPYFEKNSEMIKTPGAQFQFLQMNYASLPAHDEYASKYDLILSNPPYFFIGEGLFSPSEFKNRCRFFIDSDLESLIMAMNHCLKVDGRAYFLVRPGNHHGRNLYLEITQILLAKKIPASAEIVEEIRGTNVVCLIKEA